MGKVFDIEATYRDGSTRRIIVDECSPQMAAIKDKSLGRPIKIVINEAYKNIPAMYNVMMNKVTPLKGVVDWSNK
jgi:hypothetical protein